METENILSMADALSLLIKDDNLRAKIGRHARRLVMKKYTWGHNAGQIAEVCRSAIRNNRHRQALISL